MHTRIVRPVAAAALIGLLGIAAQGAGARFWQVSTQADFLKGEVENLSIDMHGRLVLGPETTTVGESTTPFLWALVPSRDGGVYAGSGNDGQVFKYAPGGARSVFFDAPELEVHALAPAPDGGLYVGTSPEGKIYRVAANGTSSVYFDPEDKYIWALATDARGNLYAATGEKGVIYRITAEGKGEPFYRTKATHALTLLFDGSGNLLAGTESPGKVFRITPEGTGFVLLDPGLQEISALRFDEKGVLWAAAFTSRPSPDRGAPDRAPAEEPRPAPMPSVSTEITSVTIVDVSGATGGTSGQAPSREDRRGARGAIYRIMPDGVWDVVWESADDAPYDLLPEAGGGLLVGTGNKGKIYRLAGEPARATLVARADAQQVTTLLGDGQNRLWFATSNPGKLFRLSAERSTRGTYLSEVHDAETVATWGALSWRGSAQGGGVKLFTRSGNTAVPDETWSAWSNAYTRSEGEQITSPKARYLQWKLELTGSAAASPLVTSVTAAYLQRNLRPDVVSITVHPPGVIFQKPFSTGDAEIAGFDGAPPDRRTGPASQNSGVAGMAVALPSPALGRRGYQKGLQTLIWKAEDENDDDLQYDVLYRREGETTWKALKRGLQDPIFVWDTTSVPNGTYVVKIVASDAPANPPGTALNGERESSSFDIDNAPPIITFTGVRRDGSRALIQFTVRDDHSPVQRVEYSLEADRWRAIYPKDGIADSFAEEFELTVDGDPLERAVIVRAIDGMNNVATARAEAPRGK
jgi:hypothetical protein